MKKIRIRHTNASNTDLGRTFSAHICGGGRGFENECALESYSNELFPTLKAVVGFTVIVEVYEKDNSI